MRTKTAILLAACLLAAPCGAQQKTTPPATPAQALPQNPISQLAWLVGGVWKADASGVGQGKMRIETRYVWSDNDKFIRFTTHFITDRGELKNYDGNLYWDPSKKGLAVWYMSASNAITEGPMTIDGDLWQITFEGEDFDDKPATLRVDVLRNTDNQYRWTLTEKQGEGWKQLATLVYDRNPAS
jgi:hypothetical protein